MNRALLEELLDLTKRERLFIKLMNKLKNYSTIKDFSYFEYDCFEGKIPIIIYGNNQNLENVKFVKVFVAAQHNEYTGLFGIIDFLQGVKKSLIPVNNALKNNQILIFAPLMNPYGFLNPTKENKSGYPATD